MTPADSGEYVCHVSNGAGSQETSLIVTIQGSDSSHGEHSGGGGQAGGCRGRQWGPGPVTAVRLRLCGLFPSAPSAQRLPADQDRVLVPRGGRRADPGSALRGCWAAPGHHQLVQAWGQPSRSTPGTERGPAVGRAAQGQPPGQTAQSLAGGTSSCLRQTEVGLSRSDADPQPLNPLRLCTPRPTAPT